MNVLHKAEFPKIIVIVFRLELPIVTRGKLHSVLAIFSLKYLITHLFLRVIQGLYLPVGNTSFSKTTNKCFLYRVMLNIK